MFAEMKVPVLAIVENMAYFQCDMGKKYHIFGMLNFSISYINSTISLVFY